MDTQEQSLLPLLFCWGTVFRPGKCREDLTQAPGVNDSTL